MVVSDRLIALSGTSLALFALTLGVGASPQTPEPPQRLIDFATDVRPLLDARCSECHGPTEAKNGYRLDRRSVALAGINRPNIVPRSAESSRLYRRIIGGQFGTQMPPDEPLTSDEVGILKRWIDEGAEWPDALANEADLPPAGSGGDTTDRGDSPLGSPKRARPGLSHAVGAERSRPQRFDPTYARGAVWRRLAGVGDAAGGRRSQHPQRRWRHSAAVGPGRHGDGARAARCRCSHRRRVELRPVVPGPGGARRIDRSRRSAAETRRHGHSSGAPLRRQSRRRVESSGCWSPRAPEIGEARPPPRLGDRAVSNVRTSLWAAAHLRRCGTR